MDKTTTFPSPSELIEIVARYRKALDDIYNHSDEAREAVVKHFGTVHPEIPASLRPEQGEKNVSTTSESAKWLSAHIEDLTALYMIKEDDLRRLARLIDNHANAARSAGAEEERGKALRFAEWCDDNYDRSPKDGKWREIGSRDTRDPLTTAQLLAKFREQAGVPTLNDFNDWLREQAYENILPTKESAFEWMRSRMSSLLFQERQRAEKETMGFAEWTHRPDFDYILKRGTEIWYIPPGENGTEITTSDLFALWKKQAGEKGGNGER